MGAMALQITSLAIVYSTVYSGADQRKYQSSASMAHVRGIHRWPGEFPAQMASNAEIVSIWWRHPEHGPWQQLHAAVFMCKYGPDSLTWEMAWFCQATNHHLN